MEWNLLTSEPDWSEALRTDRGRALTRLYGRTFPMVLHHVKRNQGTEQDAKDLFHDALIIFYEQAVNGQLQLTASASTYLVSICRHRWLRELDRRNRRADLGAEPADDSTEEAFELPTAEDSPSLAEYVAQLGEKCQSILLSFYYFRQTMEQITLAHHYRNVRSATVQKFKCLERLRKSVSVTLLETFYR